MVVAADREERCLVAQLPHQLESEHVAVEADRRGDVGNAQVHVPHHRARGEPFERLATRVVEYRDEVVRVERPGRHQLADVSLPALARPVGVDLDPVMIRIAEIDRLGNLVVG